MMRYFLILMMLVLPVAAVAQNEEDRGFIAGLLENSLAGEGRTVQIFGFAGALSSRASIDRIVIADDEGVWLTMEQVGLQWNRSALLRGRVDIEELSAGSINLARLPVTPESDLPAAEASGFALPDLPVSIEIEILNVTEVTLGAPVMGEAAAFSLNGTASLGGGSAAVRLDAVRTDGQEGEFTLDASFDGDSEEVALELALVEGEDGLASRLLGLPDQPSISLQLTGSGTLDDLRTVLDLRTDDAPRLSGDIVLQAVEGSPADGGSARRFEADIGGDVTALFAPQYRPFFGEDMQLRVAGLRADDGALDLETIALETEALQFEGAIALNSDLWPVLMDISGQIGRTDGTQVLLPLSGPETYVETANFQVSYDQSQGDNWTGVFDVTGLERDALQIAQTRLSADGTLQGDVNAIGSVTALLDLAVSGLDLGEEGLNTAVGDTVSGALSIEFVEGQDLRLRDLNLSGADYALTGQADISDLENSFETVVDVALNAQDLSRFGAVSGQDLSGAASVTVTGTADLGGAFDLDVRGEGTELQIGQEQADAVLAGVTELDIEVVRTEQGLRLPRLDLRNPQFSVTGSAALASEIVEAEFDARLQDAGLVLPDVEGPLTVAGTARTGADGVTVDVNAAGPYGASATVAGLVTGPNADIDFIADFPDISTVAPEFTGAVALRGNAAQSPDGWMLDTELDGPYALEASVAGRVTGTNAPDLEFDARLPDIQPLVPAYSGAVAVRGTAQQLASGWQIDTEMNGPYALEAKVAGRVTGTDAPDLQIDARLPDIRPLVPGYSGAVAFVGTAQLLSDGWQIDAAVNGPYGLEATANGRATGEGAPDLAFRATLPDVSPLVPQLRGAASVDGTVAMEGEALAVDVDATGPYNLTASVSGPVTGSAPEVQFSAQMPNIAPVVGQLSGPLSVSGLARQDGQNWFIDTSAQGPAGTQADVVGLVGADGQLGLSIAGNAPLALTNPFIEPRSLQGQAQFNLRVDGAPASGSVSGQVNLSDGRLSLPTLRASLDDITAGIALSGGRANINLTSALSTGGTISVNGPVTLSGGYPAQLAIQLASLRVVDPTLYRTTLDGALQMNGNLTGGARIAGQIDVGETQISVPSSGAGGFSIIPEITHVRASRAVRVTQDRAGLGPESESSGGTSTSYPLDINISAPSRIFVRGRGLDAELGGSLQLTGTTANLISSGSFELIRGRLDILEKRFVLDEGQIQLQGSFDPYLRFVATTDTTQGTASIVLEGTASDLEVTFESTPESPEDEVLAQIFFGRDVSQLSAFQALQLASAVATLAGSGGESVVSKLRRGFDLDDLDISTDDQGQAELTAGKYLSDNIYTDVTVGGSDGAEASINIDLTPSITVRGAATSTGDTSVGIYFERDY